MRLIKNTLLALACISVVAATQAKTHLETNPSAGNMGLVLNITSADHIMGIALPFACQTALDNKTINVNMTDNSSWFYSLSLKSAHINEVNLGKDIHFRQIDGTNKVYLTITGIDIDIDLDAEIKLFYHLIPYTIKPTKIAFTGVTFDFMLESTADDNVHWKLA